MAQLGLSGPKLPEHLRDGSRLEPSVEKFVQFLGPRRQLDDLRPFLVEFRGGGEAEGNELLCLGLE